MSISSADGFIAIAVVLAYFVAILLAAMFVLWILLKLKLIRIEEE